MHPKLIYYETMAVQWVSEGLSRFFSDLGYVMVANTVQEINEAHVPLDRIYAARKRKELLVFALQFKTPQERGDVICWRIDPRQHACLCDDYFSRFIWYCFPFMKQVSSWKNSLYHSHFVCPSICKSEVRWFMWDDYFLYFYPGGGGCHKFLEQLRHLPCGQIPYRVLDSKLLRASRSDWNFTMNYDSWGSLFYKLLRSEVGFAVRRPSDWDKVMEHITGGNVPPVDREAIIIVVDVINQAVDTVNVMAGPKQQERRGETDDLFPMKLEEGTQE